MFGALPKLHRVLRNWSRSGKTCIASFNITYSFVDPVCPSFGISQSRRDTSYAAALVLLCGTSIPFSETRCDKSEEHATTNSREQLDVSSSVPVGNENTAQWRIYTDKGAALVKEVLRKSLLDVSLSSAFPCLINCSARTRLRQSSPY